MLAPTETLALQHAKHFGTLLGSLDVEVVLWTRNFRPDGADSSFFGRSRPRVYVGTHALIQEEVRLENLGLVVIDEQHKFGVSQREALMAKGNHPDVMVMTATPIPRTLCLTFYGDLDVSVIDEMPPGRRPVKTVVRKTEELHRVWEFVKREANAGRQAYVVYPLLEESEKLDVKSVKEAFRDLEQVFGSGQVVMLHGKVEAEEKQRRMEAFRQGTYSVMVATSVIEVGVDNPQATMMVIGNAERFGLAQLHQLRGRVGRGAHQSYCVLVGEPTNEEAWERLKIMESTQDGFKIAEEDLRLRGPGDLLGKDQSGYAMKLIRWGRDLDLIEGCRRLVDSILDQDPELKHHPGLKARIRPFLEGTSSRLAG